MEFIFLTAAGTTLFTRSDLESGHWTQEEMRVTADFPYDPERVIQRGQRIAFRDPATDNLEVFEIRSCVTSEPDHFQQLTAEHIAISELQDEHINNAEITDKTAAQALTTALTGTGWSVGNNTASGTSSGDFSRGSVWQAIGVIKTNWNVYITPRVVISSAGVITGKYLDISPAGGTWRGVRLSVSKNLPDVTVTYNDEEIVTALYGYGAAKGDKDLTFKDEVWTATSSHPAKPAGQTYLEWPEKTALYGRNGRPRFGYYQNANITDDAVLLQKTWEALQRASEPKISIEGTCEDLYRLGYADEPLRLHDLALVEIEETGETFYKEIIQLDVDLLDPTGNRLNIGDYIPNIIYINRQTSHHAGGGGGANNYSPPEQFNTAYQWENLTDKYGSMIGMTVGTYDDGGNYIKAAEIALAINATTGETSALINADHVNISATSTVHTLAGSLEYDADGKLIIKDAGGVYVERTEQGVTAQFGVWDDGNLTGGVIVDKVNGSTNTYITGDHVNISATSTVHTLAGAMHVDNSGKLIIDSAGGMYVERTDHGTTAQFGVWDSGNMTGLTIASLVNGETNALLTADHINISATSTAYTLAGALEHDANGRLVIKDAGGLYVQRTESGVTAQFGVFDNGNLTGGVIVNKVNGSTNTYITGDHVNISATSTVHTLAGAMHVDNSGKLIIDSAGGMYVERTESGTTAQFGVWDRGNMTGLTIAQLVNGETNALLTADHINISGTSTVQTLAGAMHKDANGKLILDNAGGVYVERTNQGVTAQFGVWDAGNLTGLTIASLVNGETNATLNASHINISADSTLRTLAGAMHVDSNGKLVLDQAGGVYVERTNQGVTSQFGVWDRGNLTGGVMVTQINGQTTTKLSGDVIDISSLAVSINASNITINAARIDVNGIITDLATENLTCLDFTCGALTAGDDLEAKADVYVDGTITCNDITSGGDITTNAITCTSLTSSGSISGHRITGTSLSVSGNIAGATIGSSGAISALGAITAVGNISSSGGNISASGSLSGNSLVTGSATVSSLTVGTQAASWKSKTVVTSISLSVRNNNWAYTDANNNVTGHVKTDMVTDVTESTSTIHYLGY